MSKPRRLDPTFASIFLASIGTATVVEIIGVMDPDRGDTITELWRWTRDSLPGPLQWVFRIFTGGLLTWATLHFLNDAP